MLVDFETMMDGIGAKPAQKNSVLNSFMASAQEHHRAIERALKSGAAAQVVLHAHALKGAAGNLRLKTILHIAEQLLHASKQNRLSRVQGMDAKLLGALQALQRHVMTTNANPRT